MSISVSIICNGEVMTVFRNTTYLSLAHKNLKELPDLSVLPNLRYLNLLNNRLESFPDNLHKNKELRIIDLQLNPLKEVTSSIRLLPKLEKVIVSKNKDIVTSALTGCLRLENIYEYIPKEDRKRILTFYLVNRFRNPLGSSLPEEIMQMIAFQTFSVRSDHGEIDTSYNRCIICAQDLDSVCIRCEGLNIKDNQFCSQKKCDICKQCFHVHCIDRWSRIRQHCPACENRKDIV